MKIYTYSEARQNLATLLDEAKNKGEILIKRKDGSFYVVRPVSQRLSPLNVDGVDLDISSEEIVDIVRESRSR